MELSGTTVGALLNAFRAALVGTASHNSPAVPAPVGGYLEYSTAERRPLGEVRQLLLTEMAGCPGLSMAERAVISLYYGLELTVLPISAADGPSLATVLRLPVATTGRPRNADTEGGVARSVRHLRAKALRTMASGWTPRHSEGPLRPACEPDPRGAGWHERAVEEWSLDDVRRLHLSALRRARLQAGLYPTLRESNWLDLDWWSYRANLRPDAPGAVGRPRTRINSVRHARGAARMSIAIWETLCATQGRPPSAGTRRRETATTGTSSSTALLRPVPEVAALLLLESAEETATEIVAELERQTASGLSDPSAALLLDWLEPMLRRRTDGLYARAAAAVTRAAAEHAELNSLALRWFEESLRRSSAPTHLAETAINMSVVFSGRRRYIEADRVLGRATATLGRHEVTAASLALAASAWRRRLVSEALEVTAVDGLDAVVPVARACVHAAEAAVRGIDVSTNPTMTLRTEVRLAEALSVTAALAEKTGLTKAAPSLRGTLTRRAEEVARRAGVVATRHPVTALDAARLDVIVAASAGLENGSPLSEFGIRRRVRARQDTGVDPSSGGQK